MKNTESSHWYMVETLCSETYTYEVWIGEFIHCFVGDYNEQLDLSWDDLIYPVWASDKNELKLYQQGQVYKEAELYQALMESSKFYGISIDEETYTIIFSAS